MNYVDVRGISRSLIVRRLVFEVVKNYRKKGLAEYIAENRIHSDLVPRVSDGKKPSILEKEKPVVKVKPVIKVVKPQVKKEIPIKPLPLNIGKPSIMHFEPMFKVPELVTVPVVQKVEPPKVVLPVVPKEIPKVTIKVEPPKPKIQPEKKIVKPEVKVPLKPSYGKLIPLLMDSQVMVIECSGANRPLQVVAGGQQHITNLTLNEEEINAVLQKVSQEVHIPLLEGVFKAVHDKFFINAVVSRMVGSKFIIKKQSQMLEGMTGMG